MGDNKAYDEFKFSRLPKDLSILKNFQKSLRFIGGYSEDKDCNFVNDKSSLLFFNTDFLPKPQEKMQVHFDLKDSEETTEKFTGTHLQRTHSYMSWILSNEKDCSHELFRKEPKFIFLKNVLSAIMGIPINFKKEAKFYAVCLNGVIYLLQYEANIKNRRLGLWAHKLENCLTFSEQKKVVCNCDYRNVLYAELGPHKLYYAGTIDSVIEDLYDDQMKDLSACVSIKCYLKRKENDTYLQRFKMPYMCISTTLNGVDKIVVGFTTKNGIVNKLRLYDQKELRAQGKDFWNLDSLFTFAERLLTFIRNKTEAHNGQVFEFFKPSCQNIIRVSKTSEIIDFPPKWFTEKFI